ncbi:TRAP transporter small permease [Salinisphaera orenii]|uniref:TRAP transporter small permease protein n=1 Tax=Salinisphaera orenii YIM 95161 TaxID=1051139 RepID=A0A423PTR0_9GAMM|nr:TRAP transporter small permease subunit [Salinisphaera halophila]ROO28990.1 C4-dicarboxylate ABC transporter permease [Salinisphaera halophila YIM 95161]
MKVLMRLSIWLERAALAIAGVALLAMMMVTVIDVALRFLFQLTDGTSGLTFMGSVELVKYLLLAALLGAMAGHVEKSQVVVEVFTNKLGDAIKARIAGLNLLIFAAVGVVLVWGIHEAARSAAEFGEVTQDLAMPKFVIYEMAAVLLVIFTVRSLIHGIRGLVQGVDDGA